MGPGGRGGAGGKGGGRGGYKCVNTFYTYIYSIAIQCRAPRPFHLLRGPALDDEVYVLK